MPSWPRTAQWVCDLPETSNGLAQEALTTIPCTGPPLQHTLYTHSPCKLKNRPCGPCWLLSFFFWGGAENQVIQWLHQWLQDPWKILRLKVMTRKNKPKACFYVTSFVGWTCKFDIVAKHR